MAEWNPTLAGALGKLQSRRARLAAELASGEPTRLEGCVVDHTRTTDPDDPVVVCRCRRRVSASLMRDVRGYPAGHLPTDARFVCDACFSTYERQGLTDAAEHAALHDAPAPLRARLEAKRR
jgi:hypothetical protein